MAGTSITTVGGDMKNPELACDWCGDEVINGEGVYVDDDRVCSECAAKKCRVHASEKRLLNELFDMMTEWLADNTEGVFEEAPTINDVRSAVCEAIERIEKGEVTS